MLHITGIFPAISSLPEQVGEEVKDVVEEPDQPAPEGGAVVHVIPRADIVAGGRFGIRRFGGVLRLGGIGGIGGRFGLRFQFVVARNGFGERTGMTETRSKTERITDNARFIVLPPKKGCYLLYQKPKLNRRKKIFAPVYGILRAVFHQDPNRKSAAENR